MPAKRKPLELKVLRMSGKKAAQLLTGAVEAPGALKDPPEWMTPEQKLAWAYAIGNAPKGVLKHIDRSVLAGYIVAEDTHRRASIALQTESLVDRTPVQQLPMANVYLQIMNRQYLLMLRGAGELGFTPCSRARLAGTGGPKPAADGWDEVEAV